MPRSLLLAGAGLAMLVACALPAGALDSLTIDDSDASAYPTVTLDVSGPSGLDGSEYSEDDFVVREDGEEVAATIERMPTANLEVLLVVDTSGSMRGAPLQAARNAIAQFVRILPDDVKVGAVSFGEQPVLVAPIATDRAALAVAVVGLDATGDTALYDAVGFATRQFTNPDTDKAIVLLSDGADTASKADLPAAVAAASRGVRFSVISLVTSTTNPEALEQIARAGGGTVSADSDPNALANLYEQTASALLNRYRISYQSAARGSSDVVVALTTPDGVLQASTTVDLPAAPTTPTSPPTTAPPSTTPPTAPTPTVAPTVDVGRPASGVRLVLGSLAVFGALFLLVVLALPRERAARRARANLARSAPTSDKSLVAARGQITGRADELVARTGRSAAITRALDAAGLTLSPGELALLVTTVSVFASLLGLLLGGPLLALALLAAPSLVTNIVVRRKAEQRRERFLEQLPDTIQMLTSTLRSGYGLLQALDSVAIQAEQPTRSELQRVLLEQRVGRDLVASLDELGRRMHSKDFEWVAGAIEINREVGGDLAAILENIGGTIRDRRRLARQIRTLSAEGRISAYVLLALPVALFALLALINPEYVERLGTPLGVAMLSVAGVLMIVGWFWLRRLVRVEF